MQTGERGKKLLLQHLPGGNVNGGRNDIVTGLAQIDVIVGMHQFTAACPAQELGGPIGDHLVGVHVRRGPRAGLKDIHGEFGIEPALDHVGGRLDDRLGRGLVEQTQGLIDGGGGPFDPA